jgi:hypothetical protein
MKSHALVIAAVFAAFGAVLFAFSPWVASSGHVLVKIENKLGGVSIEHIAILTASERAPC